MTLEEKKAELERSIAGLNINFCHMRTDFNGNVTVAYESQDGKIKKAAYVFCSPKDTFCKVDGRFRAAKRLIKGRPTMTILTDIDIKEDDIHAALLEIAEIDLPKIPNWFNDFAFIYSSQRQARIEAARAQRASAKAVRDIPDTF